MTADAISSDETLILTLSDQLKRGVKRSSFEIGDDLNLQANEFREHLLCADAKACSDDREDADYLAAFGCEACTNDDGTIQDTALRTMSGGGHQHFLKFFRDIVARTDLDHIRRALLQSWDYADDGRGLNLRWDPADDRRYAMRWDDPSGDPIKTMRGANRLAIEALPLLPTMPTLPGLATTCFKGSGARHTFFTWPIWDQPISVDVVRSVLARPVDLVAAGESERAAMGIVAVYSSQRITIGKFRNFAPARPV
ncbi:MAG TPA: hypothetical protein VG271_15860 [Beijerinckiaceae bacterium]|nr:hypothetical protein [Beijerinckiaceae bacterium]